MGETTAAATSLFVQDNIPEEMGFASALWDDVPVAGTLAHGDALTLEFRVIHDVQNIYMRIVSSGADARALKAGRTAAIGHIYLDDAIEVAFSPSWAEGKCWQLRINSQQQMEWLLPKGADVAPDLRLESELSGNEWRVFLAIPFIDFFCGGAAAGTPLDSESWEFNIGRISPQGATRWHGAGPATGPEALGQLEFVGGPTLRRVKLEMLDSPNFGDNMVKFSAESTVDDGVSITLDPAPAERRRTREKSHMRFRVAKPGDYRLWVDLLEEPAPVQDNDEDYYDEEEPEEEPARGESACRYGVTFNLPDVWADLEMMEDHVDGLRERLSELQIELDPMLEATLGFFDGTLIRVDRFRSPNVKEKLTAEFWGQLVNLYDKAVAGARKLLLDKGAIEIVNPYGDGGEWLKMAIDLKAQDAPTSEAASRYAAAGYKVLALAGSAPEAPAPELLVLPAIEAGEHVRFVSIGASGGDLREGEYSYSIIGRTANEGGISFLLPTEADVFPLPVEADGVAALAGDLRLWDKFLSNGSKLYYISTADEGDQAAPGGPREQYNMVLASQPTREAVLAALTRGAFYSSTGPVIVDVAVSGPTLTVRAAEAAHITFIGKGGEVLSGAMGTDASYTFTGAETYVRVSVLQDVETDGFRREALTQPFSLSSGIAESVPADAPYAEEAPVAPEAVPAPPADEAQDLKLPVGAVTTVLDDFLDDDAAEEPFQLADDGDADSAAEQPLQ